MKPEISVTQQRESNDDEPYRHLAAAVLELALRDLKNKQERRSALRFLTQDSERSARELWLAWLGMDDGAFQKLLRQKVHQGQENRLDLEAS